MIVSEQLLNQARRMLNTPNRFATDELLRALPLSTISELDALDFGVIQLSDDGVVLQYNLYESELSGRAREDVLGKRFFIDVAPCTKTPLFAGLFESGVQQQQMGALLSYYFDFQMTPTQVWVHLHRCPNTGSNWILVRRQDQI